MSPRTRTGAPPRTVELTLNGESVQAPEDMTILQAVSYTHLTLPTICSV